MEKGKDLMVEHSTSGLILSIAVILSTGCFGPLVIDKYRAAPGLIEREWRIPEGMAEADFWRLLPSKLAPTWSISSVNDTVGRAESDWRTLDTCWAGINGGGMVPCQIAKAQIRIDRREPPRVVVSVVQREAMVGAIFGRPIENWKDVGSNPKLADQIILMIAE